MAERRLGRAQHALAQDAAMGVHQRERGVVADRADVAEMVGEPLQFGHQRAQPHRATGNRDAERGLRGAREGDLIGDRAVALTRQAIERRASGWRRHQAVDAFVHVAEPLLQPHHGLAVRMKAEMAGFDDPGMDRSDWNLMQARAFRAEERIRLRLGRIRLGDARGWRTGQRRDRTWPRIPSPIGGIRGGRGAPFEADRWRMRRATEGRRRRRKRNSPAPVRRVG